MRHLRFRFERLSASRLVAHKNPAAHCDERRDPCSSSPAVSALASQAFRERRSPVIGERDLLERGQMKVPDPSPNDEALGSSSRLLDTVFD